MEVKILELRDRDTFIPLLCVDMNPDDADYNDRVEAQRYFLRRGGYPCDSRPNIGITDLSANGGQFSNDPYFWGGRTRPVAHNYIIEHWGELRDGDVIDVEFILGETKRPKKSERITEPL